MLQDENLDSSEQNGLEKRLFGDHSFLQAKDIENHWNTEEMECNRFLKIMKKENKKDLFEGRKKYDQSC